MPETIDTLIVKDNSSIDNPTFEISGTPPSAAEAPLVETTLIEVEAVRERTDDLCPVNIEHNGPRLFSSAAVGDASIELLKGKLRVPQAKIGTWKHNTYGEVTFTMEKFTEAITNFENDVLGFEPYLTFGHPIESSDVNSYDEFIETAEALDGQRKRGDLEQLRIEGDMLVGYYTPKAEAYDAVSRGEYEYSSGEFLTNFTDKKTGVNRGTVLVRTALTNAPFIPHREKVVALSQSPQTIAGAVFKLSAVIPQQTIPNQTTMSDEIIMETTETPETEPVPATEPSLVAAKDALESMRLSLEAVYEEKLAAMTKAQSDVIATLTRQLESIEEKLLMTQSVAQAYSTEVSVREKARRAKRLESKGVPPALIERFSLLADALQSGSRVIKLSTEAGGERDVTNELEELLDIAVNSQPVVVQQYGQSAATRPSGLEAQLRELAQKNWDSAKKSKV
ncbi:hypothetical protein AVV41_gp086 [Microcystis phage MaMV-DC]|uniref:Uncharacterized protein n=1 Tax=Microcystis phage MaMV-DC TaxID=1357715 RepID=A0A075BS15_9CAUD|nr:hypothetical protein AVV41_gp086 [Microcystis phage MaMV-DC]AGR48651.1 hypothetical protein MaMVDC_86 [Microcystis phage MaMV-DC]